MRLTLLVIFLLQLFQHSAFSASESLQAGVQFYSTQNWDAAYKSFQTAAEDPDSKFSATYNLGNVAMRQKRYGLALGHYLNAQQLNPRDSDLRHNLSLVQSRFKGMDHKSKILALFNEKIFSFVTLHEALIFLNVGVFFLALCLIQFFLAKKQQTTAPFGTLIGASIVFTLALIFSVVKAIDVSAETAVITETRAEVKSGPDAQNATLTEVHEGSAVDVLASLNGWKQVDLGDVVGWVPKEVLLVIEKERLF